MTERFTLITELGRGGMGVVWKARDDETGRIVALKLLHATLAADKDYLARFEREVDLAKRIHSVNIVEVLGYGMRDGAPFLALEYIDGPTLRELLSEHGPYSWTEAKALLGQLTQGLADAHAAGVIHRDIKPANVLIDPTGTAKIADFGIARGLDSTRMTATSTMLGTPAYLAPEGPVDERSDIYSLGIVAYELLSGAAPFAGTTYQEVIIRHIREAPDLAKLPAESRDVVNWMLAKDPAQRPQRASVLLKVLYGVAEAPKTTHSAAPAMRPSQAAQKAASAARTTASRPAIPTPAPPRPRSQTPLPQPPISYPQYQQYAPPPQAGYPAAFPATYPPAYQAAYAQHPPAPYPAGWSAAPVPGALPRPASVSGAILVLLGAVVTLASFQLPWVNIGGGSGELAAMHAGIFSVVPTGQLGSILGSVAFAFLLGIGLVLSRRRLGARRVLGVLAVISGIVVLAVGQWVRLQFDSYNNSYSSYSYGFNLDTGFYVGLAGGIIIAFGGIVALASTLVADPNSQSAGSRGPGARW
jgi:serine/threonine-protein kinase